MDVRDMMRLLEEGRQASHAGMRLGALVKALEAVPEGHWVMFDFGGLTPTDCDSYRGYYSDLAIGFEEDKPGPTAGEFAKRLRDCIGQTFTGYKGGDFTMAEDTPVWVANYGKTSGTAVIGVEDQGWRVLLRTACIED